MKLADIKKIAEDDFKKAYKAQIENQEGDLFSDWEYQDIKLDLLTSIAASLLYLVRAKQLEED